MIARALLVLLALALSGCIRDFDETGEHSFVRIASLELSPERVLSQHVVLNVTAILDNRGGGESDRVRLEAKAFSEETGFLLEETEAAVGELPSDTTRPVPMTLRVPREGSARIDVSLFVDDLGIQRYSVVARNLGNLEPEVLDTGLRISDVDFIVRGLDAGAGGNRSGARATIQTDLYVTNEGEAASEDLRVQVKAREAATRLVSDVAWVDTGQVAPGATVIRSVNVTVPDGYNYVFEILTWRGETVVARSEGVVQLGPTTYVKPKDQEVVTERPNVADFLTPVSGTPTGDYVGGRSGGSGAIAGSGNAPAPEVPGFGAALLVVALLSAVLILRLRRRMP